MLETPASLPCRGPAGRDALPPLEWRRLLLTQAHLAERFRRESARVLCIDQEWEGAARADEENLGRISTPHQMAHVIYTLRG